MKKLNLNAKNFAVRIILFLFCIVYLAPYAYGQFGNTISGHIFGFERQPVGNVDVELLDEFSRRIARVRTSSSGRFIFSGLSAGRFRVRVLPSATDYQEQEQEIEIVNLTRQTPTGPIVSGSESAQRDFYLSLRKDKQSSGRSESIFVQEISPQAKEIYSRAIELLDNKKDEKQGLKDLRLAIETFPDYYNAIERLGTEYVKLQHYEAAEILLSRAVQINSRGYRSWYGLAYAQYAQNKINQALEAAQKATSLDSTSINALILEGILQRQTKNNKQAEKQLRKAKDLAKVPIPEIHWQLALLYGNNLNRYREAADELELFIKLEPNNKSAENIKKLIKQFREKAQNSK